MGEIFSGTITRLERNLTNPTQQLGGCLSQKVVGRHCKANLELSPGRQVSGFQGEGHQMLHKFIEDKPGWWK